ncbi:hypothetical protein [Actinoallomurus sp. NPDC052274]|uniref:hypothetical protein n=1 Tax=Actinoallomurus sp. NPDC052274 TaxID=3155420 RepID=UPI003435405B
MPPAIDAVLADGVLVPVERDDHLVRPDGDGWMCIRPTHSDRSCESEFSTR